MERRMQVSKEYWRAPDGTRCPESDVSKAEGAISVRVLRSHFVEDGIPGDPHNCGFACALKSALDIPWAEVGLTIGRIVVPDGEGGWMAKRGRISADARRLIEAYDAKGRELELPENGLMFTLHPISKSNAKESKRARDKRRRKRLATMKVKPERNPNWQQSQRSLHLRSPFRNTLPPKESAPID